MRLGSRNFLEIAEKSIRCFFRHLLNLLLVTFNSFAFSCSFLLRIVSLNGWLTSPSPSVGVFTFLRS